METILKRDNGLQIKLVTKFEMGNLTKQGYSFEIEIREAGKRKWIDPIDTSSWEYRSKPFPEGRRMHELEQKLKFVTEEEVFAAYIKHWESLKPTK